jgi:predicted Zn-dependent protease
MIQDIAFQKRLQSVGPMPGGFEVPPSARQSTKNNAKDVASTCMAASARALCALACSLTCAWLPAHALFFGYDQQAEAYKHQADYAYETQNYPSAINYYQQAINALPYDAYQSLSGLYYSLALSDDVSGNYERATGDWQHAKNCYDQLIQAAASNPQAGINVAWATSTSGQLGNLIKWRQTCDPTTPDFFGNINVRHWPASKFPLRVYVDETPGQGFGYGSRTSIMQAIGQWVAANPSRLTIAQMDDINQADIIFQRPQAGQVQRGSGGQTTYDDSADVQGNRMIKQSHVKLTCATQDFNQMTAAQKNELYNLALHESGHSLGLDGHSPSGLDVMYWKSPLLLLSARDIATIRRLYP